MWQRLEEYERPRFREYVDLVMRDPQAICSDFSSGRREEFVRLLAKGLGLTPPGT